jgi:hypothetical protein
MNYLLAMYGCYLTPYEHGMQPKDGYEYFAEDAVKMQSSYHHVLRLVISRLEQMGKRGRRLTTCTDGSMGSDGRFVRTTTMIEDRISR